MRITSRLIQEFYTKRYEDLTEIINELVVLIRKENNYLNRTRLIAILHTLAYHKKDAKAIEFAQKIYQENPEIKLNDIENWMIISGFAGHFQTFEEANSHGCGHYTMSNTQSGNLDLSQIKQPLRTNELNTRYQRLHYAASLAIGQRQSIKVIDLGGGIGNYYTLLRRLFPECKLDYTCIDFEVDRPANYKEISPGFQHISNLALIQEQYSCDLFIASGVLQYIKSKEIELIKRAIDSSRITLIDRTPLTDDKSFWTIHTRADCRHAFKIFNKQELLDLATLNEQRCILAEGICPEDWIKVFNMEEFYPEATTLFKWYITTKELSSDPDKGINFKDYTIY